MGGLLMGALAGGLKGLGDGMLEDAKAAREAAIAALARQNAVDDRNANFAHQDTTLATQEAGENTRADNANQTSRDVAASNNATSITTTGMNNATSKSDTAASEAGANTRNAANIKATSDLADKNSGQFTDVKQQADGTYIGFSKDGRAAVIADKSGAPIVGPTDKVPASVAAAIFRAHTTPGSDGEPPVVDTDGALEDLAEAAKQYATGPDTSLESYLRMGGYTGGIGAAGVALKPGGLTSNIFGAQPAPASVIAPPAAVDMLRKDPSLRNYFDQKYGQGAAARALGQ